MHITEFSADGFRNLHQVNFAPDQRLNLIIGDNAQGKTNLLDAIWLMTGCRSFHGLKERHYLGFTADYFQCRMRFHDGRREQEIKYSQERSQQRKRKISLNGVEILKTGSLFEAFHCVAFSPADTELVSGTPEKRRTFMDLCACQLHPGGMQYVSRMALLLQQRNAGLQKIIKGRIGKETALLWDAQLSDAGVHVSQMRANYIQQIAPLCEELYHVITGGTEKLEISYRSAFCDIDALMHLSQEELKLLYQDMLKAHLAEDLKAGYTCKGVQRDELQLLIDGRPVHLFGSQGQKKSTALVLKLAQAHLYNQKLKRSPVILLDDVMGELDEQRQKLLYRTVEDMQVFITLCHASSLRLERSGKIFQMKKGTLRAFSSRV